MYFVDLNLLHRRLDFIQRQVEILEGLGEKLENELAALALERGAQLCIEAVVDVGNQMIDGLMMRDPGSYEDVVEILHSEDVLPADEADALKRLISFRKMLVQEYLQVDHQRLWQAFHSVKGALRLFPQRIRHYLEHHLEPVHAFRQTTGGQGS